MLGAKASVGAVRGHHIYNANMSHPKFVDDSKKDEKDLEVD